MEGEQAAQQGMRRREEAVEVQSSEYAVTLHISLLSTDSRAKLNSSTSAENT